MGRPGRGRSGTEGGPGAALMVVETDATLGAARRNLQSRAKSQRRIALRPAGTLFSPAESLAWVLGLLGAGACIAPWLAHGWLWLEFVAATVALLVCFYGVALWFAREQFVPVLLLPEQGLRGREGQTIQLPLALTGSGRRRLTREVRLAIMPATQESESAIRLTRGPQRLKLTVPSPSDGSEVIRDPILLWSWTRAVALLP